MDYATASLVLSAVLLMFIALTSGRRSENERLHVRLAQIERRLDAITEHLGVEVAQPHLDKVEALLREGSTIPAIKAYREATGASLLEAKNAVDRLAGRS